MGLVGAIRRDTSLTLGLRGETVEVRLRAPVFAPEATVSLSLGDDVESLTLKATDSTQATFVGRIDVQAHAAADPSDKRLQLKEGERLLARYGHGYFAAKAELPTDAWPGVTRPRHGDLLWSDEFSEETLDKEAWFFRADVKHRSVQRPDRVQLRDGRLRLDLGPLAAPIEGRTLAGGGIVSRRRFRYGYAEVRARFGNGRDDDADGAIDEGWHHAFWAMRAEGDPSKGTVSTTYPDSRRTEIDGFEFSSDTPSLTQHVIIWRPDGKEAGRRPPPPDDVVAFAPAHGDAFLPHEWHTYGYEWNEQECRFFIDGRLTRRGIYPADKYEHDALNLWLTAISANWNVNQAEPVVAEYDYVRFYKPRTMSREDAADVE